MATNEHSVSAVRVPVPVTGKERGDELKAKLAQTVEQLVEQEVGPRWGPSILGDDGVNPVALCRLLVRLVLKLEESGYDPITKQHMLSRDMPLMQLSQSAIDSPMQGELVDQLLELFVEHDYAHALGIVLFNYKWLPTNMEGLLSRCARKQGRGTCLCQLLSAVDPGDVSRELVMGAIDAGNLEYTGPLLAKCEGFEATLASVVELTGWEEDQAQEFLKSHSYQKKQEQLEQLYVDHLIR